MTAPAQASVEASEERSNLLLLPSGVSQEGSRAGSSDFHRRWLTLVADGAHDAQLVELAFEACHAMVFAIANRITGSQWEAEDITQSVFETFARRLKSVRDPARIPGFLKTCAVRNSMRHVKRSRWRREQVARVQGFEEDRTRSNEALMAATVRELIERLEPEERTAVILKFVEMHSHEDVAKLMQVSVSTARRRLDSGRQKLIAIAGEEVVETLLGRMRGGA